MPAMYLAEHIEMAFMPWVALRGKCTPYVLHPFRPGTLFCHDEAAMQDFGSIRLPLLAILINYERVQLSAARIITGLSNSCSRDIVLYEADLQPLRLRSRYRMAKYFVMLISYGDQHRTSSYVCNWNNNPHLKRGKTAVRVEQDISYSKRQAPVHEWYEGNCPGAALLGRSSRRDEIIPARLRCGHTQSQRRVLKFTLLVRIAMLPKPLLPVSWLVLVDIRAICSQVLLQFFIV
ncbi:uncharacterized protein TNCV_1703781 [Trichonephila clavipes]|nr:uncharacterized protein TNCV_1703781 [Trichonephila clavipes]